MNDNLINSKIPYHKTNLAVFDAKLSDFDYQKAEIVDAITARVEVSSRDAKVIITNPLRGAHSGGGKKQKITSFSRQAQINLLGKVRNTADMDYMCTLTYHNVYPNNGKECKHHWKLLKQRIKYKYPHCFGLWFFEFQERGAPHFHFFCNAAIDNNWLRSAWQEITNDPTIVCVDVRKCTRKHGAAAYASKIYGAKSEQKKVPENFYDVGRFWGTFGDRVINKVSKDLVVKSNNSIDMFDLIRLIKRATKAHRRSLGLKFNNRGRGLCGFTAYDVSSLIFRFLDIERTALGNHFEFSIRPPDL